MNPIPFSIALGPVCLYLLVIAVLNLSKTPFVTSGARDLYALSMAVMGMAIVGPLNLFMPRSSAIFFEGWIWIPLIALYLLVSLLITMIMRPRLVIYNISPQQIRPILEKIALEHDAASGWAGDNVSLPNLGVQFYIHNQPGTRHVQLISAGGEQNVHGWKYLQRVLRMALAEVRVGVNPRGFSFLVSAALMIGMVLYSLIHSRAQVAARIEEFFKQF